VCAVRPTLFRSDNDYFDRYCDPRKVWNKFSNSYEWQLKGCTNKQELHSILKTYVLYRWSKAEEEARCAQLGIPPAIPPKYRYMVEMHLPQEQEDKCKLQIKEWEDVLNSRKNDVPQHDNPSNSRGQFKQRFNYMHQQQQKKDNLANRLYIEMSKYLALVKRKCILDRTSALLDTLDRKTKFILWVNSKETRKKLAELLRSKGEQFIEISGSTPKPKRRILIAEYQQEKSMHRIALLSLKACCDGITLTRASHAFFTELKSVPSIMAQAEDRIHRLTQQAPYVHIEYWIVKNTVDELDWNGFYRKICNASDVIDQQQILKRDWVTIIKAENRTNDSAQIAASIKSYFRPIPNIQMESSSVVVCPKNNKKTSKKRKHRTEGDASSSKRKKLKSARIKKPSSTKKKRSK
jgi:hypothetical protein